MLEAITEHAENEDIERFQPLLSGMRKSGVTLKVNLYFKNFRNMSIFMLDIECTIHRIS